MTRPQSTSIYAALLPCGSIKVGRTSNPDSRAKQLRASLGAVDYFYRDGLCDLAFERELIYRMRKLCAGSKSREVFVGVSFHAACQTIEGIAREGEVGLSAYSRYDAPGHRRARLNTKHARRRLGRGSNEV